MAVELIDTIKQKNNGTFPLVDNNDVKGGHYQVDTLAERDTIPSERRKELMFCSVIEDSKTYQLKGGIDNNNWTEFSSGSKETKSAIFVVNSLLQVGNQQSMKVEFTKSAIIKSIMASCNIIGSTDCEISIEKTDSTGIITNSGWTNILSSNIVIKASKYIDDKTLVISNTIINQGDFLRINVIKSGTTIKGLTVQVNAEC